MRGHDRINTCLPDELIVDIFRRLDSKSSRDACSLSCKRWLLLERLSRETIRIGATGSPTYSSTCWQAVSPMSRISTLMNAQLGRRQATDNSTVSSLKLPCVTEKSGTEDSDFGSICLTDAGLAALGKGFPKLEKLSFIWCSNVSSEGLISLAQKCSGLNALDLQGCYVGDQGLPAVGRCCKHLEDLNLRFCEGLTDKGLV